MAIQKVIHQIRFRKENDSIKSWIELDGFIHKFWLDDDIKLYVRKNYSNLVNYFDNLPCFSFRYEIFKWLLLNKEGGIFVDPDIQLNLAKINEFTNLINESDIIILPSKIGIHTSLLASIPNHRVFSSLTQHLMKEENRRNLSKELIPLFFYQFLRKNKLTYAITRYAGAYLYYLPITSKSRENAKHKNNALFWWKWERNKKVRFNDPIKRSCNSKFICYRDPNDPQLKCEASDSDINFECSKGKGICNNCASPLSCFRKYKFKILELCLEPEGTGSSGSTVPAVPMIPISTVRTPGNRKLINIILIALLVIAIIVILFLLFK